MARDPYRRILLALTVLVLGLILGGAFLPHLHPHDSLRHDECAACQWWTLLSAALLGMAALRLAPPCPSGGVAASVRPCFGAAAPPGLPSRAPPAR